MELTYLTDGRRHLVCRPFSIANLHRMAVDLGIGRHWFHAGDKPHYDVPKLRMAEIAGRCQRVSSREIVAIIRGE